MDPNKSTCRTHSREHPKIETEEIEVLTNLARALHDGVTMLSTLIVGNHRYHHTSSIAELLSALHVQWQAGLPVTL